MTEVKDHQRVNDILLGRFERPLLHWFAAHMPKWVTPDVLTWVGIAGAILIFAGYSLTGASRGFLWLVNFGLVVNWFGDSLDGTLARYRRIERPRYGFFVDHTVDAFSEFLIVIGLGLSPYVSFEVAAMALIGYMMMSVLIYVRTYVDGVFQISYGRFGPTEVRVILVLMNLIFFFTQPRAIETWFGPVWINDILVGLVAAVLILLFLSQTVTTAIALSKQDE